MEQHSRQEFESPEEKLVAHARGLIEKAKTQSERLGVTVNPINFAQRADDDISALRAAILKEQKAVNTVIEEAPRQLTLEQKESTLATLEARFNVNENLHKGLEWTKVKASLEANPEALWSINEMEKAGHESDVYNFDEAGFDIGTCSKESPESGRNCVFDEAAEEWMKIKRPGEKFNSNAVSMAKAMGIDLMDPNLYKDVLQKKGKFDERTSSFLSTKLNIRSSGNALSGRRNGDLVRHLKNTANDHYRYGSWRGSLRVEWAA